MILANLPIPILRCALQSGWNPGRHLWQWRTGFDPIFGFEDDAFSVLIQPDGKIVAVGSANDPATFYDFAAARYLSNGTLDTTFGVAGKSSHRLRRSKFDRARSAALQSDGRIVAAGFAISRNGGVQNFAVARYGFQRRSRHQLRTDGMTQIDFGNCCSVRTKVLLQSNGKIITAGGSDGESSEDDFLLARLSPTGALDPPLALAAKSELALVI